MPRRCDDDIACALWIERGGVAPVTGTAKVMGPKATLPTAIPGRRRATSS